MPPVTPLQFVKFEPDTTRDVEELKRQRVLCGWGLPDVEGWREEVRRGDKGLYWIFAKPEHAAEYPVPDEERLNLGGEELGPKHPDPSFRPLGHISLDYTDYMGDQTLANREEGRVTLASFFILTSQQGRGLGNAAMDEVEYLAASPPFEAKTITLNTMLGKNQADPKWHESIASVWIPGSRVNQSWYTKRGYVPYKEEPRYSFLNPVTNVLMKLEAVYMQKDL
ncbi:hypothetical protein RQP46_004792 [Phenoliferia psychrophenolica]